MIVGVDFGIETAAVDVVFIEFGGFCHFPSVVERALAF
jgi:hypothetical protein